MLLQLPSIGEYNQLIAQKGSNLFQKLNGTTFIPSKIVPIKVYVFGSGANAAVFKGQKSGKAYAIRCFLELNSEKLKRYKCISKYLKQINSDWKIDMELLEHEMHFKNQLLPILKMEWVDGILLNQFVTQQLNDNNVLSAIQNKLIEVQEDLESNDIGHGDFQSGNILVVGNSQSFQLKLIDYDCMFVPELRPANAFELGRSEFQHPRRELFHFNSKIDRFPVWVMLTALEALRYDKTLWREVMQGGYNTLDNFLFVADDFIHPENSSLFKRLYSLNQPALNNYLDKLKTFCKGSFDSIEKPTLFNKSNGFMNISTKSIFQPYETTKNSYLPDNKFRIITRGHTATVLTSTFQVIGKTPLELERSQYFGKVLVVTNGKSTKKININANSKVIEIDFI
jgi:hypothetical protein